MIGDAALLDLGTAPRYPEYPEFTPDVGPARMLELGVFGGYYFRGEKFHTERLPESWIAKGRFSSWFQPSVNALGVDAGWCDDHVVSVDMDPLGWFQWYCELEKGRRSDSSYDQLQIRRWASATHRLRTVLVGAEGRASMQKRTRQLLLQWGCDPYSDLRGVRDADPVG